jgi:hypothetical protein
MFAVVSLLGSQGMGRDARTVRLSDKKVAPIYIASGRSTILSFPSKPNKVVLGNKGGFAIEYIENDLAISAASGASRSNLFVYLEGRRFAFDLVGTTRNSDDIVMVFDAKDASVPVRIKNE